MITKDHNRTLLTVCRSVVSPVSVSGIRPVDCCGFRSCKRSALKLMMKPVRVLVAFTAHCDHDRHVHVHRCCCDLLRGDRVKGLLVKVVYRYRSTYCQSLQTHCLYQQLNGSLCNGGGGEGSPHSIRDSLLFSCRRCHRHYLNK